METAGTAEKSQHDNVVIENQKSSPAVATNRLNHYNFEGKHSDVNSKAVLGILMAGMGNSHFNKLLASLDIPELTWPTFKSHEEEIGRVIQQMAEESCQKAAALERELTIKKYEELNTML